MLKFIKRILLVLLIRIVCKNCPIKNCCPIHQKANKILTEKRCGEGKKEAPTAEVREVTK